MLAKATRTRLRRPEKNEAGRIHRITTARKSVADDQAARVRGYVISMSVRIVCFILAFVSSGPVRWTFVVAAVVIPYFAVVFANSGRERAIETPSTLISAHPQLPPAPRQGSDEGASSPQV